MSGVDLDVHALAANVRNLNDKLDEMRDENREWRNKQLEIYKALSSNQEAMANLSSRQRATEAKLVALEAWKWKSTGILTGAILVIQWLMKG